MRKFTAVRVVFQVIKQVKDFALLCKNPHTCYLHPHGCKVQLNSSFICRVFRFSWWSVPSLDLNPSQHAHMHAQHTRTHTHMHFQWFCIVLKIQMQVRSGYITLIRKHFVKLLFIPWAQKQSDSCELFHASGTANH